MQNFTEKGTIYEIDVLVLYSSQHILNEDHSVTIFEFSNVEIAINEWEQFLCSPKTSWALLNLETNIKDLVTSTGDKK